MFSSSQLHEATNNFVEKKLVGKGGFGRVFRGRLRHSDVAIKVLNTVSLLFFNSLSSIYIS